VPRLRTLVVEDEWPARNYLVELLEGSGLAQVVGAVASVDEAREVLHASAPFPGTSEPGAVRTGDQDPASAEGMSIEAVFVDVQLLGGNGAESGLDLVRTAVGASDGPMFVLATAFEDHAVEAFELGVVDYLLKPFTEERVAQSLRRLHERRQPAVSLPRPHSRIVARRKRSLVFLELFEIWAFETADRLTYVHTEHGVFDIDLSLTAIEASFGRAFLRIHRRWLVNASHIKELERDGDETRLFVGRALSQDSQGIRVPVARERAAAVRGALLANATGLRRS
jgi:two-component system, LytTR family, response regulator LytT